MACSNFPGDEDEQWDHAESGGFAPRFCFANA